MLPVITQGAGPLSPPSLMLPTVSSRFSSVVSSRIQFTPASRRYCRLSASSRYSRIAFMIRLLQFSARTLIRFSPLAIVKVSAFVRCWALIPVTAFSRMISAGQ